LCPIPSVLPPMSLLRAQHGSHDLAAVDLSQNEIGPSMRAVRINWNTFVSPSSDQCGSADRAWITNNRLSTVLQSETLVLDCGSGNHRADRAIDRVWRKRVRRKHGSVQSIPQFIGRMTQYLIECTSVTALLGVAILAGIWAIRN